MQMNTLDKIEIKETYKNNSENNLVLSKHQVEKTYEGKQGELESTFHYVAGKESGISDGDTYVTITLRHEFPFKSSHEEMHESKAPLFFNDKEFWTEEKLRYTRPISEEEFLNREV